MRPGLIGVVGVAVGLAAATACVLRDQPSWHDQLRADSPCYRVDLLDGLDEASTAEVRDLFGCINHQGHVESLGPTMDALESPSRAGDPAGIDLARAVNAMPEADVDAFALFGLAVDLLRAEDRPVDELLDLSLELIYGVRASRVRSEVALDDPSALQAGVLAPLAPVLPAFAAALLDDDLDAAVWAGDLLSDDETKRWVRTFDSLASSDHPAVRGPMQDLLSGFGDAVAAARSPGNDRWADATGDSLRDVVEAFTLGIKGGPPVIGVIAPEAAEILGDPVVRATLPPALSGLYDEGHLEALPSELHWLVSVDADGGSLSSGELSGLAALIRLLHDTNRPMRCSLDVGITDIEVDLGNLAVAILGLVADQDPALVEGGAGIIGTLVGWDLSQALLDWFADTGVCPALTTDVVDDLAALDLIYGDDADDALAVFIATLQVLKYGQADRIPAFVDLAAHLHATGAVPAVEEAIRDLSGEPLLADVVDLVPILIDPSDSGITAGSQPAADLQDALTAVHWVFEPQGGQKGWDRMRPAVQAIVDEDGTWVAVGNTGALLSDRGSQTSNLLDLVGPLLAADEGLVVLDQLGALLGDRAIGGPLLRVLETGGVSDRLLATQTVEDQHEVPLAFGGRLVAHGALEDLLHMIDLLLSTLE